MTPASGIKYTKLDNFLAQKQWRKADLETADLILKAVGKQKTDKYLTRQDIQKIPCQDLRILDTLWAKYSDNRFGFSAQVRVWLKNDSDRSRNDKELQWSIFSQAIGWLGSYDICIFSLDAPMGHFPIWGGGRGVILFWGGDLENIDYLFKRFTDCGMGRMSE